MGYIIKANAIGSAKVASTTRMNNGEQYLFVEANKGYWDVKEDAEKIIDLINSSGLFENLRIEENGAVNSNSIMGRISGMATGRIELPNKAVPMIKIEVFEENVLAENVSVIIG